MKPLIILALALSLTGCATTLSELRETAPVRTAVVQQPYRQLALCVFDGANSLPRSQLWQLVRAGNASYQLVDYQPAPRIAVIGTHGGGSPSIDVEMLFTPVTIASTRVEIRLGFSDAIGRQRYEKDLVAVLDGCAPR